MTAAVTIFKVLSSELHLPLWSGVRSPEEPARVLGCLGQVGLGPLGAVLGCQGWGHLDQLTGFRFLIGRRYSEPEGHCVHDCKGSPSATSVKLQTLCASQCQWMFSVLVSKGCCMAAFPGMALLLSSHRRKPEGENPEGDAQQHKSFPHLSRTC